MLPQSWVNAVARQVQGHGQQSTCPWSCSPFMHVPAAEQTMNLADLSRPRPVEALLLGTAQRGRQGLLLLLGAPHRGRVQGAPKGDVGWRRLPGRLRSAWLPCRAADSRELGTQEGWMTLRIHVCA